jgi:hypothetical protein
MSLCLLGTPFISALQILPIHQSIPTSASTDNQQWCTCPPLLYTLNPFGGQFTMYTVFASLTTNIRLYLQDFGHGVGYSNIFMNEQKGTIHTSFINLVDKADVRNTVLI